jgi:hypothetical protein
MSPNDILDSIRPINPSAFGMTREQAMMMQQGGPPGQGGMPPQGMPPPQGGQPQGGNQPGGLDMNAYLAQKVEDIKKRMGQGDMGALSSVTAAMPNPTQAQGAYYASRIWSRWI